MQVTMRVATWSCKVFFWVLIKRQWKIQSLLLLLELGLLKGVQCATLQVSGWIFGVEQCFQSVLHSNLLLVQPFPLTPHVAIKITYDNKYLICVHMNVVSSFLYWEVSAHYIIEVVRLLHQFCPPTVDFFMRNCKTLGSNLFITTSIYATPWL